MLVKRYFIIPPPSWHEEPPNYEDLLAIANWMLICSSDIKLGELKSSTNKFIFWKMKIKVLEFYLPLIYPFEHLISKMKQRWGLLYRIKRLSPHKACLVYSSSLVLRILDYADMVWVDKDNETKTKRRQNWSALLSSWVLSNKCTCTCILPALLLLKENEK